MPDNVDVISMLGIDRVMESIVAMLHEDGLTELVGSIRDVGDQVVGDGCAEEDAAPGGLEDVPPCGDGQLDMAVSYATCDAATNANCGRSWVGADADLGLAREMLSDYCQGFVDRLADIHRFRREFAGVKLPVLVSTGYTLEGVVASVREPVMDGSGLDLHPVIVEATFVMNEAHLAKVIRKADKLFPHIDHVKHWVGGEPVTEEGFRFRLRMVYFLPSAGRHAAAWVGSPPLGVYPTRAYPFGYCVAPDAVWRGGTVGDATFRGLAAALLIPFDDLVGMDFLAGGAFPAVDYDVGYRCSVLEGFGAAYGRAGWLDEEAPDLGQLCGSVAGALARARLAVEAEDPWGVVQVPPVVEVLRLQRPIVLSAARIRVGGLPRRRRRPHATKRNRQKKKAGST